MSEEKCDICDGIGWLIIEGIPGVKGGCCYVCNSAGKRPKPEPCPPLKTAQAFGIPKPSIGVLR